MTDDDIITMLDAERERRRECDGAHLARLQRRVTPDVRRWYRRWWVAAVAVALLLTAGAAAVSQTLIQSYAPPQVACNMADGKTDVMQCANNLLHEE